MLPIDPLDSAVATPLVVWELELTHDVFVGPALWRTISQNHGSRVTLGASSSAGIRLGLPPADGRSSQKAFLDLVQVWSRKAKSSIVDTIR